MPGRVPGEEVHAFVNDLERPVGTYLYGRRMYEVMVAWETVLTGPDQPLVIRDFAAIWRAAEKVVYSATLETASSTRTRIEREFDPEAIRRMKATADRDITVGGPGLAGHAIRAGLVDELHLFLMPVVVGGGTRSLPDDVRLQLELLDERRFGNGVVHLHYRAPAGAGPTERAAAVRVEQHTGSRANLRSLFELAEDSPARLDSYLDRGRVLVAVQGERIVGHLQLTETDVTSEVEITNMAVLASHRRRGIGRTLVAAALQVAREESRRSVRVATAAADVGNLRFHQRLGFRMRSIERDAFTTATGHEPTIGVDGIELRDRVWLDLRLDP